MQTSTIQILLIALFAIILFSLETRAQGIKRSVIGTMGASYQSSTGHRLRATTGQAPNAGTISDGNSYLRQGFQQPSSCVNAPEASFDYQQVPNSGCLAQYLFNYTGTDVGNVSLQWDFGVDATLSGSTELVPESISFQNPGLKTVQLIVRKGTCVDSSSIILAVPDLMLEYSSDIQDVICYEDQDGSISINASGGTSPYTIIWEDGTTESQRFDLVPGNYAFTLTDGNACALNDSIQIAGPSLLTFDPVIEKANCAGGNIFIDVSGGMAPYRFDWSDGSTNAERMNLSANTYSLTITDDNNCSIESSFDLENTCSTLAFYDVLTPNGDGQNDNWLIDGIESYPNNELLIYNRWGQLVFNQESYTGNWNGRHNDGSTLPIGAYYFVLKLRDNADTIHKGAITIIR